MEFGIQFARCRAEEEKHRVIKIIIKAMRRIRGNSGDESMNQGTEIITAVQDDT